MAEVVLSLGDDISTDIIYPGRYMATVLPTETPQYAFADHTEFNARLRKGEIPAGSIIVGGRNFGCGSSREQAASCIKGYEIVVVARHFARIFLQNAINVGLQLVICPDIQAAEGDELDLTPDAVINLTQECSYKIEPMPPARQAIIDAGGLIPYTRKLLLDSARL
ncbi:MAG TPA: 3-isopropylmalate dehydratase [Anaerolineales bacterium]|nr:3-isopropylmalate dehydratase [Anaerolineales bacterium]